VTVHGSEFATSKGGEAIFLATGGRFGAGTVGTFTSKYKTIGNPQAGPYKVKERTSSPPRRWHAHWTFSPNCHGTGATRQSARTWK